MVELKPEERIDNQPDNDKSWWDRFWTDLWRTDRLDSVWWAAVFIWAGVVLLADIYGFGVGRSWWDAWAVFFTGAGIGALFEAAARYALPEYRSKLAHALVGGAILLGIGLGNVMSWIWPLLLVVIGIAILRSAVVARR